MKNLVHVGTSNDSQSNLRTRIELVNESGKIFQRGQIVADVLSVVEKDFAVDDAGKIFKGGTKTFVRAT